MYSPDYGEHVLTEMDHARLSAPHGASAINPAVTPSAFKAAHAHAPPTRPRVVVFTSLAIGSSGHLLRAAQGAAAMGAELQLAYLQLEGANQWNDPMARLSQRARFLRRRVALPVEVVSQPVQTSAALLLACRDASLVCLVDGDPSTASIQRLSPVLRALLCRSDRPVWWVHRSDLEASTPALCCLSSVDAPETEWTAWSPLLWHLPSLQLLHVLADLTEQAITEDMTELLLVEHQLRQARVAALQALETIGKAWRAVGRQVSLQVLFGGFEEQLAKHMAAHKPWLVVIGSRWHPLSFRTTLRQLALIRDRGADAVIIPRERHSWRSWLHRWIRGVMA